MPYSYDLDVVLVPSEEFADSLGLGPDGAGRGLLYEDVAVLPVLECKEHQVHRLLEAHDESCHGRLRDRDRQAVPYLLDPQRDYASAGAHHVSIACAADSCIPGVAALGHGDLLLDGLGDAHGVDRVGRLVGGQAYHTFHIVFDGGCKDVVRSYDVGLHCLHGEELAARHLFQCGSVEDVVCPGHRAAAALEAADVAYVELDLVRVFRVSGLVFVPHVILLLLVTGEDPDLGYVGRKETVKYGVSETPGAAGDHQGFSCKNAHCFIYYKIQLSSSSYFECLLLYSGTISFITLTMAMSSKVRETSIRRRSFSQAVA